MRLEPNPANHCFGCGGANDRGMKLMFEQDDATGRIRGRFRIGAEYQGGAGYLHGGIIALLLDEAMGKVCRFRSARAVTAELSVEYLKPIMADQEITIEAYEIEANGRSLIHHGEIRNQEGAVLARGRGRFVTIKSAEVVAENKS